MYAIVRKKLKKLVIDQEWDLILIVGVLNSIHAQSPDIAMGVDIGGAGDHE